jgi:hypothetical protein
MQAYAYMQKVSTEMDTLNGPDEINCVIDELEFLHEAIDPEFQELCSDLITQLMQKLKAVS